MTPFQKRKLEEFENGIGDIVRSMMEVAENEAGDFGVKYEDIKDFLLKALQEQAEEIAREITHRFYGANEPKIRDIIEFIKS